MKKIRITESRFLKIKCPKCNKEQIIFGKASSKVECINCKTILTESTGGKAKIKAKVLEVLV